MPGQLSDLVEDARLDTIFQLDLTTHTYHDSDPLAGQRTILRKEHWRRKKRLGVGGFGTVWLEECDDANKSGKLRAVKEIKRPKNLVEYDRELETLLKFSHRRYSRCFVRMSGWYHDDESIFIAMDYFPHGDLETYIRDSEGPLPEQEARDIVFQTLEGLAFMHRNRFAHRDLKPANILIQSQPPQDWWVKLTDFGLSKYIQDSQASFSHRGGTTSYMAPERHGFYASGHESSRRLPLAGDMWSLGEISHVMMTKRHIFESIYDVFQFTENGQKLPDLALRESKATLEAISFIRAVMMPAPEDRLTAEVARRHPWMSNITLSTHKSSAPDVVNGDFLTQSTQEPQTVSGKVATHPDFQLTPQGSSMHLQPTPDLQNRITASNTPLPIEHLPNPHSTASRARRKSLQDNLAASNASESSPSNTQTLKITGIITSEQGVSTSKVLAPDPPSAEDASIARSWVYMMEMENIPTGSTLSEGLTPDYRMVRCQARSIDWLELIGSEVKVRSQVLDKKNKDIVWSSCDKNCQFLATAHLGKGVMLWERNGNLQIFNEERRADFNHEGSQRLAISPEGHWLARILTDRYETKLWDGIWDIKTRAFRQIDWLPDLSVDDHRRYLSNIEFSPDEQFVAVALMVPRSGKTLIEIRYTATTEVHWATEVDLRIFYRRATIKFSHDGCYLAVKGSHSYGAVILLEVPSKLVTQRFELDGSHQCFGEPYFSTDDRFIFWHQTNFLFVVWEWATGRSRRVEFVEATGDESIQPRLGRSVHAFWDHPDLSFLPNNSLVMLFSEKVFKTINTEGFEPIFDTGLLRSRMPIPAVPGEEYRLRPGLKVYTLERKNKGLYGFFGNIFGGS